MVVTKRALIIRPLYTALFLVLALGSQITYSAVLPEDRTDILFHNYDGDNSTFKGPSILVRKQFKETYSAWVNVYADFNSAASIDVETQGSAYKEVRVEMSTGIDYLYDSTVLSASFTNSSENDYEADSFSLGLSQDFFGDMSTLTMGYSHGKDDIYQNVRNGPGAGDIIDRNFQGNAKHQRFSLGWTQIFTKEWIVAFNVEASVDEGFLRNPYRSVRFRDVDGRNGFSREPENYPTTRSSQAFAIKSMYYLPWRAALKLEYRNFNDSWDIQANNYEIRYTHPYRENWIFELRYRAYNQTQASFYNDLFDFPGQFDERASDKELSTFQNSTIGLGITYEFDKRWIWKFDRATVNFAVDFVRSEYDNFGDKRESELDLSSTVQAGDESQFAFTAQITRLFFSFWY